MGKIIYNSQLYIKLNQNFRFWTPPLGGKINESISLENASLTHEFLYENFNHKILYNYLLKFSQKNLCIKFVAFLG